MTGRDHREDVVSKQDELYRHGDNSRKANAVAGLSQYVAECEISVTGVSPTVEKTAPFMRRS